MRLPASFCTLLPRPARHWLLAVLACLALAVAGGCELINPAEDVPAYVRLPRFSYSPDGVAEAPTTSAITDGWVYVNDKLLGVFELPATVPILASGPTKVVVYPGVVADGRPGTRFVYPVYQPDQEQLTLVAGQTTPFPLNTAVNGPKVTYYVAADFQNASNLQFRRPGTLSGEAREFAAVPVQPGDSLYFAGAAGQIGFLPAPAAAATTQDIYLESDFQGALPQSGTGVFAELDYRATMPFRVGVSYQIGTGPVVRAADLTVFPKRSWTKLYVDLIDEVSYVNNTTARFRLTIIGQPTGGANEYVALDNVRLLSRKP